MWLGGRACQLAKRGGAEGVSFGVGERRERGPWALGEKGDSVRIEKGGVFLKRGGVWGGVFGRGVVGSSGGGGGGVGMVG